MFFFKNLFSFKKKRANFSAQEPLFEFLKSILGYYPENIDVFTEAFTHRSAQKKDDKGNSVNFERLEFLGDALLGASAATHLYNKAPEQQEGYLTKMRSKIVSRKQLNSISKQLGLLNYLEPKNNHANLGEDVNGDLLEALVGAIYVDKGAKAVEDFIKFKIIDPYADLDRLESTITSHKSLILEWSQKTRNTLRFNTFEEQNAEDLQVFVSVIRLNDKVISKGRGTSKKKAEESASKRAYYTLQKKIENI
ncbi:ribonuclease III [Faecalibacter bovis]|uniref:Ribonuclease 3 n=1 Tax=Faecalibacter bovis TaxID=2898187 RepID=A0ABX7XFV2_9FLAO|nr:ribonuclease III [Faecalibacter bovis]QTV06714.1 ribonuclease III [Faecalibacter bovis]